MKTTVGVSSNSQEDLMSIGQTRYPLLEIKSVCSCYHMPDSFKMRKVLDLLLAGNYGQNIFLELRAKLNG